MQDTSSVPEFYVSGLDRIEKMEDGCGRHVLFVNQMKGAKIVRVEKVHIIMPNDALRDGMVKALEFSLYRDH